MCPGLAVCSSLEMEILSLREKNHYLNNVKDSSTRTD